MRATQRTEIAVRTAIAGVAVLLILLVSQRAGAQTPPDLVLGKLSIHATLPDGNGQRQVTTSCRVINASATKTKSSTATVQSAGGSTALTIPPLQPNATAYVGTTTTTSATQFTVSVTLANGVSASYEFDAGIAAVGRWRPLGPSVIVSPVGQPNGVGRITTIAVDPSSAGTVYVGARATGVWKTTDGGAHWEPLTDALPTVNIGAVAVDPTRPAYVYLAASPGFYRSTDGGHVWTLQNSQNLSPQGHDGGALIVRRVIPTIFAGMTAAAASSADATLASTTNSNQLLPLAGLGPLTAFNQVRLYLSTRMGLLVSRDEGVTWDAPVVGSNSVISSLVQDRNARDHLLATAVATVVAGPEAGVYETFNGGLNPGNWTKLQGCPDAPLPAFPPTVGLWVAQSGTTKWISVKNGLQHDLWRTTSLTCRVQGNPEQGWELLSSGTDTPCVGAPDSTWSYLYADPRDSSILYKGGIKLCRSTDGGATFRIVSSAIHDDQHAIAFHPTIAGKLYIGNDGGLYRSDDGGQSFQFNAEGLHVTEFLEVDAGGTAPWNVVGGSQDNALAAGDEVSPVWHAINLGSDPDGDRSMAVIDPLDGTVQFSVGQAIDHLSRTQSGHRDEGFDYSGLPLHCSTYSERPSLSNQFIATSSTDFHLVTTVGPPSTDGPNCNGGLWGGPPWHALFAPGGAEAFVRVSYDPSIGLFLAGGNMGSVYINFSPEFMVNVWTAPAGSVTAIVPDPARPGHYFVSLQTQTNDTPRIFEIHSDSPLHFVGEDITGDLPVGLVMTLTANPFEPNVLYAGTRGQGVMRGVRDVSGQWNWQPLDNGMPQGAVVTKLRVNPITGTIYAGTYGRGAFALDTISFF